MGTKHINSDLYITNVNRIDLYSCVLHNPCTTNIILDLQELGRLLRFERISSTRNMAYKRTDYCHRLKMPCKLWLLYYYAYNRRRAYSHAKPIVPTIIVYCNNRLFTYIITVLLLLLLYFRDKAVTGLIVGKTAAAVRVTCASTVFLFTITHGWPAT